MDLPPLTRAQLISHSMDLARANLLTYDIPLKMIAKMAVRDENIMKIPTITALNKLQFLSDILSNTPAFGLFEVSNISKELDMIKFLVKSFNSPMTTSNRYLRNSEVY